MYGSAGTFLSPENLVGRSGSKFPPDASTLSGLFFSANWGKLDIKEEFKQNLFVAGPFWAKSDIPEYFYVPIPWHKIIAKEEVGEWRIEEDKWEFASEQEDLEPEYSWQPINYWNFSAEEIKDSITDNLLGNTDIPWKYVPILHPRIHKHQRHVVTENGLFLENAVQLPEDICLVYLSTHKLEEGWYRFGGENHLVELNSIPLSDDSLILELLQQKIQRTFALITPAIWGSNRFSYRYPQHPEFPQPVHILTDKARAYRYRTGGQVVTNRLPSQCSSEPGRLGRGRYAVPPGSVYVLDKPLDKSWWEWSEDWFPKEGYSLKRIGCGLCLPIAIKGVV